MRELCHSHSSLELEQRDTEQLPKVSQNWAWGVLALAKGCIT